MNLQCSQHAIRETFYDIVKLPSDFRLDSISDRTAVFVNGTGFETVHGISRSHCDQDGRDLAEVMKQFFRVLRTVQPYAVVGPVRCFHRTSRLGGS